jgi:hypothetical protein
MLLWPHGAGLNRIPWPSGGAGFWSTGWTGSSMIPGPAGPPASPRIRSRTWSSRRWNPHRKTRRTGRGRRWPNARGCRSQRSIGSGGPSNVRHGTTTLFAALNTADGSVISSLHRRHRAAESKKFLAKVDSQVPAGLDVHLICDNYQTHTTPPSETGSRPTTPSCPLHPDPLVLAEPGRTVLRVRHRRPPAPLRPPQYPGPRSGHPILGHSMERRTLA